MAENGKPLRVLIVGAGPAGMYTLIDLSKRFKGRGIEASFDVINRDIPPGGLVVYGVAPDHQKIRAVGALFERALQDTCVRYFGNVQLGKDLSLRTLRPSYDIVVHSFGAQSDQPLGIPGEDLTGSYSAREFVAWYNADPLQSKLSPDLTCKSAVVVGAGNVAADVARILVKDRSELAKSDIADHALRALESSAIDRVVICVRRSAMHLKFTPAELAELGRLEGVDIEVSAKDLEVVSDLRDKEESTSEAARNYDLLKEFSQRSHQPGHKVIEFRFLVSPIEIEGVNGRVSRVLLRKNKLEGSRLKPIDGSEDFVDAGLIVRSVGYSIVPIEYLPYDNEKGVIANDAGRVIGSDFQGQFVVGWAADGPLGVVGTNKARAKKVCDTIEAELPSIVEQSKSRNAEQTVKEFLDEHSVPYVTYSNWQHISALEVERGKIRNSPRVRFVNLDEMLGTIR